MKKKLLYLTFFAISFAIVIGITVYYFRLNFYSPQFSFPIDWKEGLPFYTLFGRQLASLLMIFSVSYFAGRNIKQKIASFLYIFGLWDIFYYISLYILCQWPKSLLSKDLLFVIPLPWTGPVVAPIIVSFILIIMAIILFYIDHKSPGIDFSITFWIIEFCSTGMIVFSFLWNYKAVYNGNVPGPFPWLIFSMGAFLGFANFLYNIITQVQTE